MQARRAMPQIQDRTAIPHLGTPQAAAAEGNPVAFLGHYLLAGGGLARGLPERASVFWRGSRLSLARWECKQLVPNSAMAALFVRLQTQTGIPVVVCSTHLKAGFSVEMESRRQEQSGRLSTVLAAFAASDVHGSQRALCVIRAVQRLRLLRPVRHGRSQGATCSAGQRFHNCVWPLPCFYSLV